MTVAGTDPEAWQELCRISIIPNLGGAGAALSFEGMTEDISGMEWGEKDIEGVVLLNGGRIAKYVSMTDESLTLKIYDINAENTANEGAVQLFHKQATADVTQPIAVNNTITRETFGIILLWAETLPATGILLPAESKTAYRIQITNAYMTSYKPNFDDKIKSAEVTFKWTPFQQDGTSNKREESTDGTAQLPAAITSATSF